MICIKKRNKKGAAGETQVKRSRSRSHWRSSFLSLSCLFYSDIQTSGNWIASHGRSVMRLNRHALFLCSNYAQYDQALYLFSDLITIDVFIWLTINICWFASGYTVVFIWALTERIWEITANEQTRRFFVTIKICSPAFSLKTSRAHFIKETVWQNVRAVPWHHKIKPCVLLL